MKYCAECREQYKANQCPIHNTQLSDDIDYMAIAYRKTGSEGYEARTSSSTNEKTSDDNGMGFVGNVIGGGLGWMLGGPIGGIVGAVLGGSVLRDDSPQRSRPKANTQQQKSEALNARKESQKKEAKKEQDRLRRQEKRKADKAKKMALFAKVEKQAKNAVAVCGEIFSKKRYITNAEFVQFKEKFKRLRNAIKPFEGVKNIGKDNPIKQFMRYWDIKIREYNETVVRNLISKSGGYFSTFLPNALTDKQMQSVFHDEDRMLVFAGAGTGKTTTIVAKAIYLMTKKNIDPSRIVLLAFNSGAASEIQERISEGLLKLKSEKVNFKCQTFHALGLGIIGVASQKKPDVDGKNDMKKFVNEQIVAMLADKPFKNAVEQYFTRYLKVHRDLDSFSSLKEYEQYLKNTGVRRTLAGEIVKSFEEVEIANYLFFNNIKYEYEREYEFDVSSSAYRQYKPDFYLVDYGVYLEHFALTGVNKDGSYKVPEFMKKHAKDDAYIRGVEYKRSLHREHKTRLIETYSYEKSQGKLIENLKKRLIDSGVKLEPKSTKDLIKALEKSRSAPVYELASLVMTIIKLSKSNLIDFQSMLRSSSSEREKIFLTIYDQIHRANDERLRESKKVDYAEMISESIKIVNDGRADIECDYILVDEYQDMSNGRYELVKAILKQNKKAKLFCVGDDWQSIYRFTGSHIALITKFEEYFGYHLDIQLDQTFRFGQKILNPTRKFIESNPHQHKKQELFSDISDEGIGVNVVEKLDLGKWIRERDLICLHDSPGELFNHLRNNDVIKDDGSLDKQRFDSINQTVPEKYKNISSECSLFIRMKSRDGHTLLSMLMELNKKSKQAREIRSVYVINRYNKCYRNQFKQRPTLKAPAWFDESKQVLKNLKVEFITAHRSKGLEVDYVIIDGVQENSFPCGIADDPLIKLVLPDMDTYPNAEERRLFYVAMTRAKKALFLLAIKSQKSPFYSEMDMLLNPKDEAPSPSRAGRYSG